MSEQIYLHEYRNIVDDQFVGFKPNGASVKPVHIAGGSLRSIYGAIADTKKIKKLSYVANAAGKTPNGNENAAVYTFLTETERIDEEVGENELESMRNVMQKLLATDKGVYSGTTDGMVSYSAGSKYFITKKAMYEDAGEFIGGVIKQYCPELASYIKKNIDSANDPITLLFSPVLEDEPEMTFENSVHEDIPAFKLKYKGDCLLQKKFVSEYTGKLQPNRGEIEQYYIRNDHEAIASKEDWEKAQILRASRKRKTYVGNS